MANKAGDVLISAQYNSSAPTLSDGQVSVPQLDAAGNLKVVGSATPTGTQDVNIKTVNAVTVVTGTGAVGTGTQRIAVGTDTATIAGSAPGTAGTASANVVTVQGIAFGTPVTTGGTVVHITSAPTVTAGGYVTGNVVGGLVSLATAARVNAGSGTVLSVLVTVKTALTAPFDVLFFDTNPTNSTFTDNSALAVNVADLPFLCGVAHCVDLVSGGTPQILQAVNCGITFKLSAAATILYAVIVMRGAETLASTSAIQMTTVIAQD